VERVVVFDIETYGSEELLSYRDFTYLKDREKGKTEEEIIQDLSLNPFVSSVVSAGYALLEGDTLKEIKVFYLTEKHVEKPEGKLSYMGVDYEVSFEPFVFAEFGRDEFMEREKELISNLWEALKEADRLVSFNGRRFDVPFLRIRSLKYDIIIPETVEEEERHLDLMSFLFRGRSFEMGAYSLDFVSRHFGFKTPKEKVDGKSVKQLFLQERYDTIAKYNAYDVIVLTKLFLKLRRYVPPPKKATEKQLSYLFDLLERVGSKVRELRLHPWEELEGKKVSVAIELLKALEKKLSSR